MGVLDNKVALITGAGQGVGQGIALAMAREGAAIAVTGRTLSKCQTTVELIEGRGGKAIAIELNVKDHGSMQQCVDHVVAELGGLNILVNNAQEVPLGNLFEVKDESFTAGFESGPLAVMRLMKICHPHLKGDGSIINLASTSAKRWDASGFGAYAAVKEAIRALTKAAASEWGSDGIRTNVILPHAKSPGMKWWLENCQDETEAYLASIPQGYVGDCEDDIGKFVAQLCSDNSRYVNGQSIAIDGGQAYMG
jgi:NAD(P)-dependent dehydrogenase (short-subunit alcohol dehydrogenase family)